MPMKLAKVVVNTNNHHPSPSQSGCNKSNKKQKTSSLMKHCTAEEWVKLSADEHVKVQRLRKEKKAN
jgi:hypothetical protein